LKLHNNTRLGKTPLSGLLVSMEFIYHAIDKDGKKQTGKIEANNEKEVLDFLRTSQSTPLKIAKFEKSNSPIFSYFTKVKTGDIVLFTRQLSSMTMTGLTLVESLNILREQNNKPKMQEVIVDIISSISDGSSFSKALEAHKEVFSDVYIALIKAAESGGLLDKVLLRLADNMEKSEDLKKTIRSALFYPIIIVSGVFGVIVIMNIFVIPQLGQLYENLNLPLPATTKIVLGISKLFTTFTPIILILIGPAIFFIKRFTKTDFGIKFTNKVKIKLPVFGQIFVLSTLDEITRTLSLLITSGTSIIEALNIAANVANNYYYRQAVKSSAALVEKGVTISAAMQYQNIFPPLLVQMLKVGESTGKIDESLLKMSEYFERDLDARVKMLTTSIEPILIIVLGVSVAFLIISVITPIYSLISQIQ